MATTESFYLELAKVVIPSICSLAGLIISAYVSIKLASVSIKLAEIKNDVNKIEVATNSMKDALVESTAKESLAIGMGQGVEQERLRAELKGESVS